MASVTIVGDGPGGLSAALFLAKNGHLVSVFGTDNTAMNYAYLHNYLGIPEMAGTDFQRVAKRQVAAVGARLIEEEVTAISINGVFTVHSESGEASGEYLILTEGKNPELARSLGVGTDDDGAIAVPDAGVEPRSYENRIPRLGCLDSGLDRSIGLTGNMQCVSGLDSSGEEDGCSERQGGSCVEQVEYGCSIHGTAGSI